MQKRGGSGYYTVVVEPNRLIVDIETTSLDPSDNGRVVCICTHNLRTNENKSFFSLDEGEMLTKFWEYVGQCGKENDAGTQLVGFNVNSFDVPYLIHRSLVRAARTERFTVLDLRQVANAFFHSYNKFAKGDLAYWAKILGIEQETHSGKMVPGLFLEGKYDEIVKHCVEDVSLTKHLFKRIEQCNLL